MKTTNAFKLYNRNKFYNSIYTKTVELGFNPNYLPTENDRTNFGNKLNWEKRTKEVESLLSRDGLQVLLTDALNNPVYIEYDPSTGLPVPEQPFGVSKKSYLIKEKIYKTKRILKSKNDVALYTNIKNWYESNNKFTNFVRKRKIVSPPTYEIIEYFFTDLYLNLELLTTKHVSTVINSEVDLNISISSKKNKLYLTLSELDLNLYIKSNKQCVINGGIPPTNNFAYLLFGGNANSTDPITLEQWCNINQTQTY